MDPPSSGANRGHLCSIFTTTTIAATVYRHWYFHVIVGLQEYRTWTRVRVMFRHVRFDGSGRVGGRVVGRRRSWLIIGELVDWRKHLFLTTTPLWLDKQILILTKSENSTMQWAPRDKTILFMCVFFLLQLMTKEAIFVYIAFLTSGLAFEK